MEVFPKLIYRVKSISIKIRDGFFGEIDKLILKFIWKYKESWEAKLILKMAKVEGLTSFQFWNLLQSYANQDNVQWHKDQWYRIKSPEKKNKKQKKLLVMVNWFLKRAQLIHHENNNHFKSWCWDHWISMYKRIKLNPFFTQYTKINVKMDYRPRSKN